MAMNRRQYMFTSRKVHCGSFTDVFNVTAGHGVWTLVNSISIDACLPRENCQITEIVHEMNMHYVLGCACSRKGQLMM